MTFSVSNKPSRKTRIQLALLTLASAAVGVTPRRTVGEPLCRIAGSLWYLSAPAARAAVRANLRHILRREPSWREVLTVFQHGAFNYWDTFATPHITQAQFRELMVVQGAEHITAARAAGKGVVCATAHLGSVAFVGQIVPALGHPMVSLVEPLDPPELLEFFTRHRQGLGARMLPIGKSALRELFVALRRNEVVGLVTDRDVTGTGPMIDFFGAPTQFPDGVAALSVRTGAPILIAIATRRPDGRFDALFEPLPPVPLTGDPKTDVLRLTQAVARRLEYHIAIHPEQWTVFQKRWPEAQPG
jgi:phosphatidylinositol dimannoside acyltransferase